MNQPVKRPDLKAARDRRGATRIGDWVLHPDLGILRNDSGEVRLNAKTLHVLLVLLDAGDKGVSRTSLLDQVWGESYPTDTVISRAMADLRAEVHSHVAEIWLPVCRCAPRDRLDRHRSSNCANALACKQIPAPLSARCCCAGCGHTVTTGSEKPATADNAIVRTYRTTAVDLSPRPRASTTYCSR